MWSLKSWYFHIPLTCSISGLHVHRLLRVSLIPPVLPESRALRLMFPVAYIQLNLSCHSSAIGIVFLQLYFLMMKLYQNFSCGYFAVTGTKVWRAVWWATLLLLPPYTISVLFSCFRITLGTALAVVFKAQWTTNFAAFLSRPYDTNRMVLPTVLWSCKDFYGPRSTL